MSENLLQMQSGVKAYGARVLFDAAAFSINSGEHVGVIGPNGAGKTTLFRVLVDEEKLDAGNLIRSRKLKLGYLSQHDHWLPEETGNSYLERLAEVPLWDLKAQGRELQLTEALLDRKILSLSGGYRMRIKLLGLVGQAPNLMLLDEPTNYLDLETNLVLERFLQGYEGAFLLISHDREFLRRTTDHILEVEAGEITKYNGNIDDYFEQKALLRSQLEARAATQADKRKQILDFVARFGAKATKARQAQSRLKSLARMEVIEVKPLPTASTIRIPPPKSTGKVIFEINEADFGYEQNTILKNVSLFVTRGDHIAVVGLNGAGKSTFLKGISGTLAPKKGTLKRGLGVDIAYFAQHVVESLDPHDTVLSSLESAAGPSIRPQEVLELAGSLMFSGDDIRKPIHVLSGGEKSRVALGRVLLERAPCLVLDEPTNHLDFQTVEALIEGLKNFAGTVIVVSHDRGFIRRVGSKILEVARGEVRLYPGSYEEYVWSLQQNLDQLGDTSSEQNAFSAASAKSKMEVRGEKQVAEKSPRPGREELKRLEREERHLLKQILDCEQELERLQKESGEMNERIASAASGVEKEWIERLGKNSQRVLELEAIWLDLLEQKEKVTTELQAVKR